MKRLTFWPLIVVGCLLVLCAQLRAASKSALPGSVTGHVYCSDTNAPARMATVELLSASAFEMRSGRGTERTSTYVRSVHTELDGSFVIHDVAPGLYYVTAFDPGHPSALESLAGSISEIENANDALRKKLSQSLPDVVVTSSSVSSVDITMPHGAAISGTIRYDDGSPADSLEVRLLTQKEGKWGPMQTLFFIKFDSVTKTDDRGFYRISGLPPGEYVVAVRLCHDGGSVFQFDNRGDSGWSGGGRYCFPIFSGNSTDVADAKPVSVSSGEDATGENIWIPLNELYRVSGYVTSAIDGSVINSGRVSLVRDDDKSQVANTDIKHSDGSFVFRHVPKGKYTLRVVDAASAEFVIVANPPNSSPPTRTETQVLRRYEAVDESLLVDKDMTGLSVTVPNSAAEKPQ